MNILIPTLTEVATAYLRCRFTDLKSKPKVDSVSVPFARGRDPGSLTFEAQNVGPKLWRWVYVGPVDVSVMPTAAPTARLRVR